MIHPVQAPELPTTKYRDPAPANIFINMPGSIGSYAKVRAGSELYEGLIPKTISAMRGVEIAGGAMFACDPSTRNALGGNLLDVIETSDGFDIALVDVSGRGEKAIALVETAQHLLRAAAAYESAGGRRQSVGSTVHEVGLLLSFSLFSQELALLYVRYDARTAGLSFCSCSPWRPVLIRDRRARLLGEPSARLGGCTIERYPQFDLTVAPGDLFVGYTSGLTESRRYRNFLGTEPVCRFLEEHSNDSPASLVPRLLSLARAFSALEGPDQDAMVIVVRFAGVDAAPNGHHKSPAQETACSALVGAGGEIQPPAVPRPDSSPMLGP